MAKKLTPIERAIAGEPTDRRRRYDQRMRDKGFVRVTFTTKPEDVQLVRLLAKASRELPSERFDELMTDLWSLLPGRPERPQRSEDAPDARPARKARR